MSVAACCTPGAYEPALAVMLGFRSGVKAHKDVSIVVESWRFYRLSFATKTI